ncbi:MAG TPA: LytR C-terminal domain-containing protein, partial [Gaiellaceae bacterium]|nr:LytR C-terminal domain-containing protein [Gaiellaceae bacterium]
GLSESEIEWLEDGRLYRFSSQNQAILAGIVYATTIGVDRYEARRLAVVGALAALLSALAVLLAAPNLRVTNTKVVEPIPNANLLPPWKLQVTVENGNGNIVWTRSLASRIGAMGYTISKVGRADRFDYPSTTVYYGAAGHDVGLRLARQLGAHAQQAPGLAKRQLLVVVGPKTVANASS